MYLEDSLIQNIKETKYLITFFEYFKHIFIKTYPNNFAIGKDNFFCLKLLLNIVIRIIKFEIPLRSKNAFFMSRKVAISFDFFDVKNISILCLKHTMCG